MDIINYLLIVVALANLLLGAAILKRSRKKANVIYAIAIFSIVLWVSAMILFRAAPQETVLLWCRLLYAAASMTASTFLYFTTVFPRQKFRPFVAASIIVLNLFILYLTLLTNTIIAEVVVIQGAEPYIEFGSFYNIFSGYISGFFTLGFIVLARNYYFAVGVYRDQIRYIFIGYFLAANAAMVTNLLMPYYLLDFRFNWLGQFFSLIMAGFTTYAIVRYRLLNLKFIFTRSLVYVVLVGLISILFVLISSFTAVFLENQGFNELAIWIVFAIGIVLGLNPLRNLFANLTDRVFYKEKIDYSLVIKNLANSINEEIDLESLDKHISYQLAEELKLQGATILLAAYKQEIFLPVHQYQHYPKNRKSTRKIKPEDKVYHNSHLIKYVRKHKDIIVTDELERYMYDIDNPRKQKELEKVYADLVELKAGVITPIIRDNDLTGMLVTASKVSGEAISDEDINVLQVVSAQLAAALERSKLYEEVQAFNVKLQKEVDHATRNLQDANTKLTVANANLKELDKAKSEFMSIASHQLRTPLAGIVGYLSMVLEGDYGKLSKQHNDVLGDVFQATQRLVRLVNTLLNVTRIEAGRFTLFYSKMDLVKILDTEIFELRPTAQKKGLELSFQHPKKLDTLPIQADDKIREVFLNLIDNAIKYTNTGHVTVALELEKKNMVHVTVSDSGIGIDPEEAKKLFGKFVRGSKSSSVQPDGSGLGLYIVKKIVEGHHGKIWAESEGVGKGTVFHVRMPITQKHSEFKTQAETVIT